MDIIMKTGYKIMICTACIGDDFLRKEVKETGKQNQCEYCGKSAIVIPIEDLAKYVELAFQTHYRQTDDSPDDFEQAIYRDPENTDYWERDGELIVDVIKKEVGVSEEVAEEIRSILYDKNYDRYIAEIPDEELPFDKDSHYEKDISLSLEDHHKWANFEQTIKYEARFLNRKALDQMSDLFDKIDQVRTKSGKPIIVDAGPDTELSYLYRARVFQSDDKLISAIKNPDKELGSPPSNFATAGRMNAKGISVFYGATDQSLALAEVRPPVGSQVVVAQFDITRPLKLLDLTALSDLKDIEGSIFDLDYTKQLGRVDFLADLNNIISKAILPDDQDFDYLPTQAVADFLANECKVSIDGIIYKSAQTQESGSNVVLFHKSARCYRHHDDSDIKADYYCGYEDEPKYYGIKEIIKSVRKDESDPIFGVDHNTTEDKREKTLRIRLENIEVFHINAVQVERNLIPVKYNQDDEDSHNSIARHFGLGI